MADSKVGKKDKVVRLNNKDEGSLEVIPMGTVPWKVSVIQGQTEPVIQGWYGAVYGTKKPSAAAVYSASIDSRQLLRGY